MNLLPNRSSAQREVIKSFLADSTHTGQFLSAWLLQAWMRPFAPALPKGNEIASEEDPVTNTIAPVRVANDPGTT